MTFTQLPDPTKHVNFSVGMVLGADDFTQEFRYLSNRGTSLGRQLGSGICAGLNLVVNDAHVEVTPGTALDSSGQLITVAGAQCADLGKWLAANAEVSKPGEIEVFVLLSYADTQTDDVAIPPAPTATSGSLTQPSRIQDSFSLRFSLKAPDQTDLFADRALAAWLARVTFAEDGDATVERFLEVMRHAAPTHERAAGVPIRFRAPPPWLRIPINRAGEYIGAALRLWAVELSPRARRALAGDVLDGGSDPTVLIGRLRARTERAEDGDGVRLKHGSVRVAPARAAVVSPAQLIQDLVVESSASKPGIGHIVGAGSFVLRPGDDGEEPTLEEVDSVNVTARIVSEEGETERPEHYVHVGLIRGPRARHHYVVNALPLVRRDGPRYLVEQIMRGEEEIREGEAEVLEGEEEVWEGAVEVAEGAFEIEAGEEEIVEGEAEIREGEEDIWEVRTGRRRGRRRRIREGERDIEEGIDEIAEGAEEVAEGAAEVREGEEEIEEGADEIREGERKIAEGEEQIRDEEAAHGASFLLRLSPLDRDATALPAGFSVQITDLGPPHRRRRRDS